VRPDAPYARSEQIESSGTYFKPVPLPQPPGCNPEGGALRKTKSIRKGEAFTVENLTIKRPGTGISPMLWYDILKMKAARDFYEDEIICL
jgi:hypothetical protein